jgi:hypothetical protein
LPFAYIKYVPPKSIAPLDNITAKSIVGHPVLGSTVVIGIQGAVMLLYAADCRTKLTYG